jgi:ribosomal protein S21
MRPKNFQPDNSEFRIRRGIHLRTWQDAMTEYKKLIRRLKDEGFFDELRERESFVKKSTRRKNAQSRAIARERKRQHRQQEQGGPVPSCTRSRLQGNKGKRGKRDRFMIELTKNAKIRKRNAGKGRPKTR